MSGIPQKTRWHSNFCGKQPAKACTKKKKKSNNNNNNNNFVFIREFLFKLHDSWKCNVTWLDNYSLQKSKVQIKEKKRVGLWVEVVLLFPQDFHETSTSWKYLFHLDLCQSVLSVYIRQKINKTNKNVLHVFDTTLLSSSFFKASLLFV